MGKATAPANMRRDGTSGVISIGDLRAAAAACLSTLEQKLDGDVTVSFQAPGLRVSLNLE